MKKKLSSVCLFGQDSWTRTLLDCNATEHEAAILQHCSKYLVPKSIWPMFAYVLFWIPSAYCVQLKSNVEHFSHLTLKSEGNGIEIENWQPAALKFLVF